MGTQSAQKALQDNLRNYVSAQNNPVMYNLCQALVGIAEALDEIRGDLRTLDKKVDQLAARRP